MSRNRTILLVEDEALIALAEQQMLERNGYAVLTAGTGEKAVEIAKNTPEIELVLMDIDLGRGIDGTEAARRILAERNLPIAFLSSHTEPEVVEKTENITSYGYIVKNSGETVLLASLRMAFRLHEAHMSILQQRMDIEVSNEELRVTNEDLIESRNRLFAREESLAASERRFRSIVEGAPDPVMIHTGGRFAYLNPAALRIFGAKDPGELVGQPLLERIHPDFHEAIRERLRLLHKGLESVPRLFEHIYLRMDGGEVWVETAGVPIEYEGKRGALAFVRDVSERRLQVEKLRQGDLVFTHALDMLCIAGFDGFFKVLNPSWSRVLGWSTEELLARPWVEFVHPDDREATNTIRSFIVDGQEVYRFENRYICKDGEVKWLSWNSYPYPQESIMFGVARDITGRKRIEAENAEHTRLLEVVTETSPDTMYLYHTKEQRHLFINRELLSLLGFSNEEIRREGAGLLLRSIHPDDLPTVQSHMREMAAADDDGIHYLEYRIRDSRGADIRFGVRERVYRRDDAGKPEVLFGVVQDITDRKNRVDGRDTSAAESISSDGQR